MHHQRAGSGPGRAAGVTRRGRGWPGLVAVIPAVGAGVIYLAPRSVGTTWTQVEAALVSVDPRWWPALAVVWLAGLWAYAVVMSAALPGLSGGRAIGLNLAGSAVANTVPLGGAASLGLTTAMMRSWGFRPMAVTSFLLLTNLCSVASRLLLGLIAAVWLLAGSTGGVSPAVLIIAGSLVAAGLVIGIVVTNDRALARAGRTGGAIARLLPARSRVERSRQPELDRPPATRPERDPGQVLLALRGRIGTTMRTAWAPLTLGSCGSLLLLAVLLELCLRGLGITASAPMVIAAVGIERLATALPITPGGAGTAELALVACLSASGVPPADALAATLLYRFFTFFLEIPLGAAIGLAWYLRRHRRALRPAGLRPIRRAW
jgi:uncharacterized membrane protein YbhN (UPF0104 family)